MRIIRSGPWNLAVTRAVFRTSVVVVKTARRFDALHKDRVFQHLRAINARSVSRRARSDDQELVRVFSP